jgi:hypothetical protein
VIFKRVTCIEKIVHRVPLTSLLYVFKRIHYISAPLCPTQREGWIASLLLGESQRRLEVREAPLDNLAAAETAAEAAAAVAAAVGGSAARPQAREGQGQEAQAGSARGLFAGPALRLYGRRVRSQMPHLFLM